jgi:hypothetical protein
MIWPLQAPATSGRGRRLILLAVPLAPACQPDRDSSGALGRKLARRLRVRAQERARPRQPEGRCRGLQPRLPVSAAAAGLKAHRQDQRCLVRGATPYITITMGVPGRAFSLLLLLLSSLPNRAGPLSIMIPLLVARCSLRPRPHHAHHQVQQESRHTLRVVQS